MQINRPAIKKGKNETVTVVWLNGEAHSKLRKSRETVES
jgi:hypothetical protein